MGIKHPRVWRVAVPPPVAAQPEQRQHQQQLRKQKQMQKQKQKQMQMQRQKQMQMQRQKQIKRAVWRTSRPHPPDSPRQRLKKSGSTARSETTVWTRNDL